MKCLPIEGQEERGGRTRRADGERGGISSQLGRSRKDSQTLIRIGVKTAAEMKEEKEAK